jgi:hypothetical protein
MTRENTGRMVPLAAGGRKAAGPGARLRAAGATRRGPGRRWHSLRLTPCPRRHASAHPARLAPGPAGTTAGRREPAPARRPWPRTGTSRLPRPPCSGFPWSCPLRRGTAPARARMARLPRPARCAVTSQSTPALTPAVPETGPRTDTSKTNGKADAGQQGAGLTSLLRRGFSGRMVAGHALWVSCVEARYLRYVQELPQTREERPWPAISP